MSPKLLLDNFPCRDLTRAEVCKIAKALAAGANRAWEGYEYTVQNSHLGGQLLKIEASIFEEALHILRAILTEGKPREEMPQNGDCK